MAGSERGHRWRLRRRALVAALVLALLGGIAGAAAGLLRPAGSEAMATILLNPLDGNPFSTSTRGDNLTNMVTEAQLVSSEEVVNRVIASTGTDFTPDALVGSLTITVPTNTQLIRIAVATRRPEAAAELAQAFAVDFLAARRDRAVSQSEMQINRLREDITARQEERDAVQEQLSAAPAEQVISLTAQLNTINTQLVSLQSRVAQLRAGPFDPGQVVTPARVQAPPTWREWWALAAAGLVAGFLLGVLIHLLRRRPFGPLGAIRLPLLASLGPEDLATHDTEPVSGSLRGLALAALTADTRRPLTWLVATLDGEPPRTVDHLARAVAATGNATVVVDTSGACRDGAVDATLADLLADDAADIDISAPHTLIARGDLDGSEDRLLSPRMGALVQSLREQADIVLIAAGGEDSYAATAVGPLADRVILETADVAPHGAGRWAERALGAVVVRRI